MKSYLESCSTKSGWTPVLVKLTVLVLIGVLVLPLFLQTKGTGSLNGFLGAYIKRGTNFFAISKQEPVAVADSRISTSDGSPISKLIGDIRVAVAVASKGLDLNFKSEDRQAWEERFPCRSRTELNPLYEKRKHDKYVPVNTKWQAVLDEYAVLHRVCMSAFGDLNSYVEQKTTGCKFVVAEAHYGLGNKIYHMSSLLVYAVLTQRVILIPSSTFVPSVLCEPFPGSSWAMPDDLLRRLQSTRANPNQLFSAIDESVTTKQNQSINIYAAAGGYEWGPETRFWCETEQAFLSDVTWLSFDGCLHHLPKLFAVPTFRPILESIFPDRVVLTHVLRTAMLPADPVWRRIQHVEKVYLQNSKTLVGVQVRFLHGDRQYEEDNDDVNRHILKCLRNDNYLPDVCPASLNSSDSESLSPPALNSTDVDGRGKFRNCSSGNSESSELDSEAEVESEGPPVVKVLVASLFTGLQDFLDGEYHRRETVNGEAVAVVQLTHDLKQGQGVEEDSQALVEVIALSLSDVLMVTPFSTFGGLAQGYGAMVPYFIEFNKTEEEVPCQRGLTTEPCYLGSAPEYDCRYDATQHSRVANSVPYLQKCMDIDVGPGYQMLLMNEDKMPG